MADPGNTDPRDAEASPALVDVSSETLTDLAASPNTALRESIRLIIADVDRAAESISGWTSYVD